MFVRPRHPSEDYTLKRNFNYFRGEGVWVPLADAQELLYAQASEMPDNRLAVETNIVLGLYMRRYEPGEYYGAYPRAV